jgi:signal transduction histidine kinase
LDDIASSASTAGASQQRSQPTLLERLMTISRDSVLEEMASGIAHELNQPLGAIVTFAQTGERILNRPDASIADAREIFQLISREALSAAEGILRMRKLFQRDALVKAPCSMGDVVRELALVLDLLANQTGVKLVVDLDPALPRVGIDRLRIQHVLFTLVQNALEASTPEDRPTAPLVRIEVRGDRYGVEISVIDAGRGISPEQRAQIFHPFYTTKPQGTGLGLASARAIVEAHEGTIGFEGLGTSGTRFWFRIPACE